MTDERKIEKCFELIGLLQYEVGKILTEKRHNYKIASHIQNWQDYLKETGLTYNKAQILIDVYETFPDADEKPFDRMWDIARLKKYKFIDEKKAEELYEKAKGITIKDWRDEINKIEKKTSYLDCEHKKFEEYIRCLDCGRWIKK